MGKREKVRVGITMGDPNGIGLEIIMKTFSDSRMLDICTPVLYASTRTVSYHRKALNISDFNVNPVKSADEIRGKNVNLINLWDEEIDLAYGTSSQTAGEYAFKSLEAVTKDIAANKVDVMVTAPINKSNMPKTQFPYSGQTEYLASYANEENPLMIMISEGLRVGLVSGHVPLKDVPASISREGIVAKLRTFQKSLKQDFQIDKPRIAVLGLNPHAGDDGLLGEEEKTTIVPAIEQANEEGIFAFGPYGADGLFGSHAWKHFDGILAMYHDQGLAPFKAMAFETGVNYTAGLPIVRTSPDHGVGYDIAGKNEASESSFREAVYLACDIYKMRKAERELQSNSMQPEKALAD